LNIVVGVADMKVSQNPNDTLVTYSLGSCVGIAVYDPVVRAGGLLHVMLPEASMDAEKARLRPFMFTDSGISALFKSMYELGSVKQRMKVVVAGGSRILDDKGFFNIGTRNYIAVRKIFKRNHVVIVHEDVGGNFNRTMKLDIKTGRISIVTSKSGVQTIACA